MKIILEPYKDSLFYAELVIDAAGEADVTYFYDGDVLTDFSKIDKPLVDVLNKQIDVVLEQKRKSLWKK